MDKDYLKIKIDNLKDLRNIYALVIMGLTGYIFTMYAVIPSLILYTAACIDVIFILHYINVNNSIDRILKIVRSK